MNHDLPPGIPFLARKLPVLFAPPVLLHILLKLVGLHFSAWIHGLLLFLSLPAASLASTLYTDLYIAWDASRRGAVLPPRLRHGGPGGLAIVKHLLHSYETGYPGEPFKEYGQKFGQTYNMRIMFENQIITLEPEYMKAVLATQFDSYEKGSILYSQLHSLLGSGVFNVDGEEWKYRRGLIRPFFTKDRIKHFDIFERHEEDLINQFKERLREGHPVDFQDAIHRFTLDSATEFLFATDVCSLSVGLPYPASASSVKPSNPDQIRADLFSRSFAEAQVVSAVRSFWVANWPLAEFWEDKVKKHMKVVHAFIEPILEKAVARKRMTGDTNIKAGGQGSKTEIRDEETFLDYLVNLTEDRNTLRDETTNIMIAGRDTTAAVLTFIVYMLAMHPAVLRRLREEILNKIGPSRRPTYEDLRELKYLRAVINETLRLYPPAPFNIRCAKEAAIWPSKVPGERPFYIPANTRILWSTMLMQRRTDLWGPDALEFDPDRFLDERLHKYLTPNPFIFLPFNAGPRICPGQQFAINEMSYFIIRLLQNFSGISLVPEAQPVDSLPPAHWATSDHAKERVWPMAHITMFVKGGLWVRFDEANPT